MARVQNTLIGRASGSVGNVVFYTYRLINVIRSRPENVFNPNTPNQQTVRSKFGYIVELYRLLKPLIVHGLKNRNRKMTAFNFFQKVNGSKLFSANAQPGPIFNPENLKVSYGLLNVTPITFIVPTPNFPLVRIFWNTALNGNQSLTDISNQAIWNETKNEWAFSVSTSARVNRNSAITLASIPESGDILHCWLYFNNPENGQISDTSYGNLTVQ